MKNHIIFCILMMLFFSSCKYFSHSIIDLEKKEMPFDSVPCEVKAFFYKIKEIPISKKYDYSGTQFVNLDTVVEYQFETIKPVIGPDSWISYYKLIDKTNSVSYRIEQGTPFPIIIFSRRLFIPTEYNVLSMGDFDCSYFNCYYLDNGNISK